MNQAGRPQMPARAGKLLQPPRYELFGDRLAQLGFQLSQLSNLRLDGRWLVQKGLLIARTFQVTRQGVVVPSRNRVELVVMAPSAGNRLSQKRLPQHVDLIID